MEPIPYPSEPWHLRGQAFVSAWRLPSARLPKLPDTVSAPHATVSAPHATVSAPHATVSASHATVLAAPVLPY